MPSDALLSGPWPEPQRTVRYRPGADGVIDLFHPPAGVTEGGCRLVMVLHGGYWRAAYDRRHLRPMAAAIAAAGLVVALPEFRRVGGGGEWPTIGDDIEMVVRAVRDLVSTGRPTLIDPAAPMTLIGHSAGGHLALWAGLRAEVATVDRVIALAPVADILGAFERNLSNGAVRELLGGSPDEVPAAYAAADPLLLLSAHARGPSDTGAGIPPRHPGRVSVVHGDADGDVPVSLSRAVAARFPGIEYLELPGVDHFALVDPGAEAFQGTVLPLILDAPTKP